MRRRIGVITLCPAVFPKQVGSERVSALPVHTEVSNSNGSPEPSVRETLRSRLAWVAASRVQQSHVSGNLVWNMSRDLLQTSVCDRWCEVAVVFPQCK